MCVPTRLTVQVQTPDGRYARWARDSREARDQPDGLTFSTAMPGGFESMSCTLARDPSDKQFDLVPLSRVTVEGAGGQIAWQGRLETIPDVGGNSSAITPQCVGYQAALADDATATMIYVDADLGRWNDPPLQRQIVNVKNGHAEGSRSTGFDASGNATLLLNVDGTWDANEHSPMASAFYDSQPAGKIAAVWAKVSAVGLINRDDSAWQRLLYSCDHPDASDEVDHPMTWEAPGALWVLPKPSRFAAVQGIYLGPFPSNEGAQYAEAWGLAVYGQHGLPLHNIGNGTGPPGVLASEVIQHAINRWAPVLDFIPGMTVMPSQFVIPQLAFTSPTTASDIVKKAAEFELLQWAVWEGPTFYCNAIGESDKAAHWRARIGQCQLQETGVDVARLYNGVLVNFTAADGTAQTVGPPYSGATVETEAMVDRDPLNPVNVAKINRWGSLSMGSSTPEGAQAVGQAYLQAQKELNTSGQATLTGHVEDSHGVSWPAWQVRAGDTLSIIDAHDTSPRRIVSTSYEDVSVTNTIQLDQPPDSETALLERLSVALSGAGLS